MNGQTLYGDSVALLTGVWGPTQTVSAKVQSINPSHSQQEVEVWVRGSIGAHHTVGYEISWEVTKPGGYAQIVRWNGALGDFTVLNYIASTPGVGNGDVISATVVGNVITGYVNGVQSVQATDTTYANGQPGIGFWNLSPQFNAEFGFNNFSATDVKIWASDGTGSGGLNSVQTLHDQAACHDGDTITIPSGTFSWTTQVTFTKGITLSGNTTIGGDHSTWDVTPPAINDASVIIDNIADRNTSIINFPSVGATQLFRLTGLTFRGNLTGGGVGWLRMGGQTGSIPGGNARIDHIHVNNVNMAGIWFYQNLRGVADHIVYDGLTGQHMQNVVANGDYSNGDVTFTQAPGYGSSDFFFMEDWYIDNAQSNNTSAGGWDCQRGGKYVVRYCWLHNVEILCHGTEGSRYHGGRAYELYNNHYIWDGNTTGAMDGIRSGTMIAHDNTFSGSFKKSGWGLQTYRTFHNFGANWGGATGLNPWDSNDGVVYVSGTCTAGTVSVPGGAITVVDNTKNMTPGQYVSYQISKPDGFMMRVNSNTATTFVGTDQGLGGSLFNVGDTYVVMRPLVCIDQPCRGAGDLIVNVTARTSASITLPVATIPVGSTAGFPTHGTADVNGTYFFITGVTATSFTGCTGGNGTFNGNSLVTAAKNNVSGEQTWTRQVIEPCYEWNNIYTPDGTPLSGFVYQANAPMTVGVDYFMDHRVMPGYTPYRSASSYWWSCCYYRMIVLHWFRSRVW